jgi:acyl carrier protein
VVRRIGIEMQSCAIAGELPMVVADDVKVVIAKELKVPVEEMSDERKLADLGAESLDVIEIVFQLEEKFDIDISVKMDAGGAGAGSKQDGVDMSDFTTVGDICRAVQKLVDAKTSK